MAEDEEKSELLKGQDFHRKWMREIYDAQKREKTFRKQARDCVRLYEGERPADSPFAILYSNTETLSPAVYNARPIPIVQRRFKDADPVGKAASEVSTRALKYLLEVKSADYDEFDELIPCAVTDALITNRGFTRFRFDAAEDGSNRCVYGEEVRWDKLLHGHARTWKKVPWLAFEWDMNKEELQDNFAPEIVAKIKLDDLPEVQEETRADESKEQLTGVKIARLWEVWDKATRKVFFISECYKDGPLKIVDDPLGLAGFFPGPKPLNFFKKTSTLVPTPLYVQYEEQARELNAVTTRLKNLIKTLKVRGWYNTSIEGIEKVINAEDNVLVPAENLEALTGPGGGGADMVIWTMPMTEAITAVQNLYTHREQVKQVIYEITGVSDILRGASVASETATAQNIKNQWGTLRLKKMQKEVQRYCRDCLEIMLEIAGSKFDVATFAGMTGMNFPTEQQKMEAQFRIEQIQREFAMQQAFQPPQMGANGGPPMEPEIPQELQDILSRPSWEEIIGLLADDLLRSYKIDIETNSTLDAEAAQDKQDIAELMNALSQFLNGLAPLVEQGIMDIEVAKGILLTICRRYTFGPQLEDAIMNMQPQQKGPDPEQQAKIAEIQAKSEAESKKRQLELQKLEREADLERQLADIKVAVEREKLEIDREKMMLERDRLAMEREKLGLQAEANRLQSRQKIEQIQLRGAEMRQKSQEKSEKENAPV